MKKKKFSELFLVCLLLFFSGANFVFGKLSLEVKYPKAPGGKIITETSTLIDYLQYFFNFAIGVLGIIAFLVLIFAGLSYLTSAGDPEKMKAAKSKITSAFLGVIILLSSYLLLRTINSELIMLKVPELKKVTQEPAPVLLPWQEKILTSIKVEIPTGKLFDKVVEKIMDLAGVINSPYKPIKSSEEIIELAEENIQKTSQCDCSLTSIIEKEGKERCSCDPCQPVRQDLQKNQNEIQKRIEESLKPFEKDVKNYLLKLQIEQEKLQKGLELMERCPLFATTSLNEYYGEIDEMKKLGGKMKKVRYWQDIDPKGDQASFYCLVGGTIQEPTSQEVVLPEYPPPELGKEEEFKEYCPHLFPFGELLEKLKKETVKAIEKLEKILLAIEKIEIKNQQSTLLLDSCTSDYCQPLCQETKNEKGESEEVCSCQGSPCQISLLEQNLEDLKEAAKEMEGAIGNIAAIMTRVGKLPGVLNEKVRKGLKSCSEPNWYLTDCETAKGNIGPEDKIIEDCYSFDFYCCQL